MMLQKLSGVCQFLGLLILLVKMTCKCNNFEANGAPLI